jgi:hypothetical protein
MVDVVLAMGTGIFVADMLDALEVAGDVLNLPARLLADLVAKLPQQGQAFSPSGRSCSRRVTGR